MSDPEDDRVERAVDEARRQAEARATAEILALEQDLERQQEQAARALDELERRLGAEARGGSSAESQDRERRLIAERDEATAALRRAKEELARLEPEGNQERAEEDARRSERERELLEQSRAELEARIRRELEGEMAERIARVKNEADSRASAEVAAARQAAEARYASELESRERTLEREREAAREAADAAQRRLDELSGQIEAAGAQVEGAETRLVEERDRVRRDAEQRIESGMRRLKAESDARIEEALASVESESRARAEKDAEVRVSELQELVERLRESEEGVGKRIDAARRETRQEAERAGAEREAALAAELEDAEGALRAAKHQLREAEARAEAAERKLGEAGAEDLRRAEEEREDRFSQIEERIKSVADKASGAQARAAAAGVDLPERTAPVEEPEPPEKAAEEGEPGLLQRMGAARRARRDEREAKSSGTDINAASFEQLRDLGLSVTQATRVIAYRERRGGFDSVDDLDTVPGIPPGVLDELKEKLSS